MAMDVDREPLATGMRRSWKATRNLCPLGQACEQHSKSPPSRCLSVLYGKTLTDIRQQIPGWFEARSCLWTALVTANGTLRWKTEVDASGREQRNVKPCCFAQTEA